MRPIPPVAAAAALAALALVAAVILVARGGTATGAEASATISADLPRPQAGQRVTLRARIAGALPGGARIVVLAQRLGPSGAVTGRSRTICRIGARACLVRVGSAVPRRTRFRALVRIGDRTLRASQPLTVAWRAAPGAPGAPSTPGREGPAPPAAGPGATPPLPPGLPGGIAGFEGWTRLNAAPIPPDSPAARRVGTDAHRGTKDVYVNVPREVALNRPFPSGAIVVKTARRGDAQGYALVAIMRKIAGVDPAHGDWRFTEYLAGDGGAFTTGPGLSGAGCWGCHGIAADTDWVFTPTD